MLVGLRQHRDWTVIRPRAFAAALFNMQRAFRFVIADIDADIEGEDETGSLDVEERNNIARHTATHADIVVTLDADTVFRSLQNRVRSWLETQEYFFGERGGTNLFESVPAPWLQRVAI